MNKGVSDVSRCTLALRKTSEFYQDLASNTAQRMLADVEKLAPDISSRAAEIEALRQIPPDLIEALRAIGVFRMFVPRSRGGMELDLASALEIISALSRIDGSVGWNAMIGSGGGIFAPLLPREIYDRLYETGPDTIVAGSSQPAGTAEKEGGRPVVCQRTLALR